MKRAAIALIPVVAAGLLLAAISPEALDLRNRGIAELENEQPMRAEEAFRALLDKVPGDPLPYANLAVAALRQQRFDEALEWVGKALRKAPGDPRLLALQGEILQWAGKPDESLAVLTEAAAAAPARPEIQYALYRQATTYPGEASDAAAQQALGQLAELRPENLVVLLGQGQRAIQKGDRAAATAAFLRVRELAWQAPAAGETLLDQILGALEEGDPAAARVPALRLENVLKITAMYREGLREVSPGIQGIPLERFRDEPPARSWGPALQVRFRGRRLGDGAAAGGALVAGDFDGDQRSDLAWIHADGLEVRLAAKQLAPQAVGAAEGLTGLLAADLDNDGAIDLVGHGSQSLRIWRGAGDGSFSDATAELGLGAGGGSGAAVLDFDIEGDLDLALAGGRSGAAELWRNALAGPLEAVGKRAFPLIAEGETNGLTAADLDRDGDTDLLLARDEGLVWLDNLRQGRFVDRTRDGGLGAAGPAHQAKSADLDNDGLPDLLIAGSGLSLYRNTGERFAIWQAEGAPGPAAELTSVVPFDADNDGRLDLAVGGPKGLAVLTGASSGALRPLPVEAGPAGVSALAAADLDGDGDLDLAAVGELGLWLLENDGGNANRWLTVRLRGLDKGNSKNNLFGFGATVEVRAEGAYQYREVDSDATHLGLGRVSEPDLLRVVWNNGVPQNRLAPRTSQWIVEEQVLKGSCPFLYAWDGERVRFVTDLLWGAPVGLPVASGAWAGTDPEELVLVEGARPRNGIYRLEVTEELWEAAFIDHVRLWVVDHPEEVEVASSLRIVPGESSEDRVLGTRGLRPLAAAWDGAGREVGARVAIRDDVYADGWERSRYQGVAAEPWAFTLDLGEAPAAPVRLHLEGWIFPADASLNLAVAQRSDLSPDPPRLEVETEAGWEVLMPAMGHPAGKTKIMVVDTPPLPAGARRLRIVSGQWLSWDRISWSATPADGEPVVQGRLLPERADLHFRGFSARLRSTPNGPHLFDYSRTRPESPWLPFPGRYTRYGDVRELLASPDDLSVILAPGDELSLAFDASGLAPTRKGWRRSIFLESHGWDKDADRNTWEGHRVEPLPFRAMSGYPYGPGEAFPDTPEHRRYRREWLTRVVESGPELASPWPIGAAAGR